MLNQKKTRGLYSGYPSWESANRRSEKYLSSVDGRLDALVHVCLHRFLKPFDLSMSERWQHLPNFFPQKSSELSLVPPKLQQTATAFSSSLCMLLSHKIFKNISKTFLRSVLLHDAFSAYWVQYKFYVEMLFEQLLGSSTFLERYRDHSRTGL